MDKIILHPTETSQWHALINEAQALRNLTLSEDIESYLVFLLMRFTTQPKLAESVLAIDFFESHQLIGQQRFEQLKVLGDKCLLFSGLFPEHAERKRVKVRYFIDLGQSAYSTISIEEECDTRTLYSSLAQDFVVVMDVLNATREIDANTQSQPTIARLDLCDDQDEAQKREVLRQYGYTSLVLKDDDDKAH